MSNPFSTRHTRPGAIDYLFPPGQSAAALIARLRDHNWRGQIIGPHGSGKSTLLVALLPALESAGRRVLSFALHPAQHRIDASTLAAANENTQIIVDGYEQLSWWQKVRLKSHCRRTGSGLLVTAHGDGGLPTLYRTEPSPALAVAIVARLLPQDAPCVDEADVQRAYASSCGNIREALFSLYDLYQERAASNLRTPHEIPS